MGVNVIAAEEAIIRNLAADPGSVIDGLFRNGVDKRWFRDELYREAIDTAQKLRLGGRDINVLSIMSFSKNGLDPKRWPELMSIWQNPNAPVDWEDYLQPLRNRLLLEEYDKVLADATDWRKKNPNEVRDWLPVVASALGSVITDLKTYDPRPSTHFKEDLRRVVAKFGIPYIDRALKGGIWDAALVLVGGISNHGKSTMAYTLASSLVRQGIKTVFVTTETLTSEVTVGVLRPLTGLSDKQVRLKDDRCNVWLPILDKYLSVYDNAHSDMRSLKSIVSLEEPLVVLYDFIKAPSDGDTRTPEHQVIAGVGEALRELGNNGRCTVIGFGQFSSATSEKFRKQHDLREPTLFGSARLYHATDQLVIMCRHWVLPQANFFKVKKDRLPTAYINDSLLDWEFILGHDPVTHSFFQTGNEEIIEDDSEVF